MGMFCHYRCDNCGWELHLYGPREFFYDAAGKRQPYGHPGPCSAEAMRQGIHGFDADMYCPVCAKMHQVVLTEFPRPVHDLLKAWEYPEKPEKPQCPDCGQPLLSWLPEDSSAVCPECRWGRMIYVDGGVT